MYALLLPDLSVVIENEFELWRVKWINTEVSKRPNTDVGIFFPNICIWLQNLAILPISTAQAERTLSTVDRNVRTAT